MGNLANNTWEEIKLLRNLTNLFKCFVSFILTLYQQRFLIIEMTKRDIMTRYAGSFLGFFWAFINPLIMISILCFVFSFGFRAAPAGDVPFVVWLTAGISAWFMFTEFINRSTVVISSNSYLVKKMVFPLSILVVVKLLSTFVTHFVLLTMLFFLILLHGMPFSIYWFQVLYYFGALSILILGLGWTLSAINVFVKDTAQIVSVILQIGFWMTPIFWNINMLPEKIQFVIKFNPMCYIVQGYRESFIYFVPFWKHLDTTLYFWVVAIFFFIIGAFVFRRLRLHFVDVL